MEQSFVVEEAQRPCPADPSQTAEIESHAAPFESNTLNQ